MKHFASQEDTVMMIHMYLQILQQYNIDLNLSRLREVSSSPVEDHINVFSHFRVLLCYFPQTHKTKYIDSTLLLLMSTFSLNPSALQVLPFLSTQGRTILLSSQAPALFPPALLGRWLISGPGNLVLLPFFPLKKKANPRKCVLPLSFSNTNKNSAPPTEPNQASPKHLLLHPQVAATCGTSGAENYIALLLLVTAFVT